MEFFGYLGTIAAGVTLGLVGGGGSILIVPILIYLFSIPATLATAYSLLVVGLAGSVGAVGFARQGLVQYRTAIIFFVPASLGVFIARRWIVPSLPPIIARIGEFELDKDLFILLVFAIFMIAASYSMIRRNSPDGAPKAPSRKSSDMKVAGIVLQGLGVGLLTGFVGAGGGFLIIPALVVLANLPMSQAVGTSLLVISANSVFGFLSSLGVSGRVDWTFLAVLSSLAISGVFLGLYLGRFIPGKKLQVAFGWFILIVGTAIIAKELSQI